MKALLLFLLALVLAFPASATIDPTPQYRIENVTATDGSVQQSVVFTTPPGWEVLVERSEDLETWTPETSLGSGGILYSVGQEMVFPLRQFAPPPPPPPGGYPTAPLTSVSVSFRPSSGLTGGTVASWPSLTGQGAVSTLLPGNLDAGWEVTPLYWQSFDGYSIIVWNQGTPVAPPTEAAELDSADAAFKTVLTARFADMNAEVAANQARTRNLPPPAPPAPGSRLWLRATARGVDTDGDGSSDADEFAMTLDVNHPSHAAANAFAGDANDDGIPDGQTLDTDRDGTADFFDAGPGDSLVDWQKLPAWRYALFELSTFTGGTPEGSPLMVNGTGDVLYINGVATDNAFTPLVRETDDLTQCIAVGMNDAGNIVGTGLLKHARTPRSTPVPRVVVWWQNKSAAPVVVETATYIAGAVWDEALGGADPALESLRKAFPHDSVLDSAGRFIANSEPPGGVKVRKIWQGGAGSFADATAASSQAFFTIAPDGSWGPTQGGTELRLSGATTTLAGIYGRLGAMPTPNRQFAIGPGAPVRTRIGGGAWQEITAFKDAIDFCPATGTAFLEKGLAWQNGLRTFRIAPGLSTAKFNRFIDVAPTGWLLVESKTKADDSGVTLNYLGMAIRIEGVDTSVTPSITGQPAMGVDDISVGVEEKTGNGAQKQHWLMAPAGGDSNTVRFLSGASAAQAVTLASAKATFSSALVSGDQQVAVTGDGSSTAETFVHFTRGSAPSAIIEQSIGIKTMRRRTVKVAVHPVANVDAGGGVHNPTYAPTKADLEAYLNRVYGKQVNIFFDVTVAPKVDVHFDTNNDGLVLLTEDPAESPEMAAICVNPLAAGDERQYDIDVWICGGVQLYEQGSPSDAYWGWHIGGGNTPKAVVDGDMHQIAPLIAAEFLKYVVSHEMGHMMIRDGHPDTGKGPAPLPGTDWQDRLMCSGRAARRANPGIRLVKTEWDAIETWAKAVPDERVARQGVTGNY